MPLHFPLITRSSDGKALCPLVTRLLGAKLFYVFLVLRCPGGFHTETLPSKQFSMTLKSQTNQTSLLLMACESLETMMSMIQLTGRAGFVPGALLSLAVHIMLTGPQELATVTIPILQTGKRRHRWACNVGHSAGPRRQCSSLAPHHPSRGFTRHSASVLPVLPERLCLSRGLR